MKSLKGKINATLVISLIFGIFSFANAFFVRTYSTDAEHTFYFVLYLLIGVVLVSLAVFSFTKSSQNKSKLPFVYLLTFGALLYCIVSLIANQSQLDARIEAIAVDTENYTTDVARSFAIDDLRVKTNLIVANDALAIVCLLFLFYFETIRALDGETHWSYSLVFGLSLLFLYFAAYNQANFLNSVSDLTLSFWSLFFESRTVILMIISAFVISTRNDYLPSKDAYFLSKSQPTK
jgi:hypothetical protein